MSSSTNLFDWTARCGPAPRRRRAAVIVTGNESKEPAMRHSMTVVTRANAPLENGIDDCLMLCNLATGDILSLNATARAIWEAIAEPATITAICETLQRSFAVDAAECLRDVTEALNEFERRKFVQMRAPAELADAPQRARG